MTSDALIIKGDCLNVMAGLPDGSIDAIVTDPPYGLGFMGKNWDHSVPGENFWREALRVAKPGCHILAAGGTRTYHRLTCAIEDAGWEIRDCIMWLYGSGFPKSLDVSKAIDREAGAEREVIVGTKLGRPGMAKDGSNQRNNFDAAFGNGLGLAMDHNIYAPATDAAKQWQGWGTALKPAYEPFILARKPLDGTVASNVQKHGCGGLNVDGCRVPSTDEIASVSGKATLGGTRDGYDRPWKHDPAAVAARQERANAAIEKANTLGRWPANVIHDGSDEVVAGFPDDNSRFFYCAKASPSERGENHHPTVKPIDLMKYLCRLITPSGGLILDPFCGSGSTGVAAMREGFNFIGIELNHDYAEIARRRIDHERNKTPLFSDVI